MKDIPPKPVWKRALRRVVPESMLRDRQIVLRLGRPAGPTYARLRLLDSLGVRPPGVDLKPSTRSVVFVCFGNIMRSPMAEALFRREAESAHLEPLQVTSAGVHAIPGSEAHPWALAASAEMGVPLTDHRSRLLTAEMVDAADAVFAMDFQNLAELLAFYPESREKFRMLAPYAGNDTHSREIPDPYLGNLDTTRGCYTVLEACIRGLARELVALRIDSARVEGQDFRRTSNQFRICASPGRGSKIERSS
jgi:protein-tyrosine phosphatase